MKTARTRRTFRSAGLVAVAAAAAFSLTACQDGGGKDDDAGSSSSSSSSAAAKDSQAGKSDSDGSGSAGDGNPDNGNGHGGDGNAHRGQGGDGNAALRAEAGTGGAKAASGGVKRSACDVGSVQVRLQPTGGSAPVILLKATNKGDDRCDLYGYPFVGYPGAQAPIKAGGGQPQAVVSLEPGTSAYAALSLEEGDGANTHREKELTVELANRDQNGTGSTATVNAPEGAGLALSDNSTVSYWNTTPELALQ
ncbi:DUF4232 domain-containing protein [Streptomyces tubbatahanensis]|uniref:DUF4232 domain-containing protein n=1 Tax=Streptomyces tubbatahanensis TaxID=2923272 RepID=A0ABY3XTM4_9ACTN|nr:DUF4232 domain-containing protein [Streptomyces tubbatahanensis]UNS97789.1 DUF4232 domain-containing protein [Streptomyces tubbatahanensis]